jgi:hypothetical protein
MASHQKPPSNMSVMENVPRSSPAPFAFFWHRTKNPHKNKDMVWSFLFCVPILVEISSLGNNNNKQISHPRFAV